MSILRLALRRRTGGVLRGGWKDMQENLKERDKSFQKFDLPPNSDLPLWKRLLLPNFIGKRHSDDRTLIKLFVFAGVFGGLLQYFLVPPLQDFKKKRLEREAEERRMAAEVEKVNSS